MTGEVITFELIRKIQTEEQKLPKLTKLPENFYSSVSAYLEQKKQLILRDDRRTILEIKNIERLVEDIFNRRERKILNAAIVSARTNIPPENLNEEERMFYNSIVNMVKQRRDDKLQSLFTENKDDSAGLIVFKENIQEFVGSDLENYGPYKKGDIAKLPKDNMKILMEKGVIEEFKVNKNI